MVFGLRGSDSVQIQFDGRLFIAFRHSESDGYFRLNQIRATPLVGIVTSISHQKLTVKRR